MKLRNLEPWANEPAAQWIGSFGPWIKMTNLIKSTLKNDPQQYPHQTRSAAALVIMLCRENVWPNQSVRELDEVVDLARRQMVRVKSHFSAEARKRPALLSNPSFKNLMTSIDEEIRMLESRMSDPKLSIKQSAPCTWGDFWSE